MRMILLGVVFLLALTLGNAFLLRRNATFVNAHDFAPVQLTQSRAVHYEWDAFVWREIAAIAITIVVFGTTRWAITHRSDRSRTRHDAFANWLANRRGP